MPIRFKDREAKYPNRWTMKKSDGTSEVVTLIRNDEPVVEGTPLNAETINSLSDVAGAYEARAQSEEFANAAKISEAKAANAAVAAENNKSMAASSAKAAADSENTSKKYLEQVKTITTGAQGWYATPAALQSAVPIGENGWFAFVGTTDTIWTWDSDTSAWVDTGATSRLAEYYTRSQMDAMLAAQRLKDHPVGSPFWTITDEDPNVTIGGTWVKIAENRAIMGASETHPAGTTAEAGLPDITGTIDSCDFGKGFKSSGAFTLIGGESSASQNYLPNSSDRWQHFYPQISLSAAAANPIYGASDTVQPASYYFNIWIRTA
nr:MAG TPA: baseplate protein [Caudoviricetes sp.]